MAEPTAAAQRRLAERLRELRTRGRGVSLTQSQVASALGGSIPLISSWENANAIPPEERLKAYALLFCVHEPVALDAARLPDEADLSHEEEDARRRLIDELIALRDQAIRPAGPASRPTGALGGRFWYFPDGAPIRIITTRMWPSVLDKIPYANPWHPNYIESYADADRDATIELFGHIRAENPTADVRFLTAGRATQEDLTGHVVLLGQGDELLLGPPHPAAEATPSVVAFLAPRLELPLGVRVPLDGDRDFDGEFVVTLDENGEPTWFPPDVEPKQVDVFRPRFRRDMSLPGRPWLTENGLPSLEYDVALLARRPNQFNLATTVTVCMGVFSRGTYGAVRALTDASLRSRNEEFLLEHFPDLNNFWVLFYVPVFSGLHRLDTMTPDLERPFHRLRSSRRSSGNA